MSAEYKRRTNHHGDPVLTITITGPDDIYRLSWNLLHAQCEFSQEARATYRWLRRSMGAKWFDSLDQRLTGGEVKPYAVRKRAS